MFALQTKGTSSGESDYFASLFPFKLLNKLYVCDLSKKQQEFK